MNKQTYRNLFLEIGKTPEEVDLRVEKTFNEIFYGSEKFYFSTPDERMGYLVDTGNNDTRTEGISYGMMMCVQLDKKKEFDQLWTWAKEKMQLNEGPCKGYFAWSVLTDGQKNSDGPAPDGEEFFAMALFFASHRWGDGVGIYEYGEEARKLLRCCINHNKLYGGSDMWDRDNHLIKFVPGLDFTDPSYHLPHFYDLFAKWAYPEDQEFFSKAAEASREYLKKACHEKTGMSGEYSYYDGTPYDAPMIPGRHDWFYSDAYRTIANIGLDYEWTSKDSEFGQWERLTANNIQRFFAEDAKDNQDGIFEIDGTVVDGKALHPVGLMATLAQASLASDGAYSKSFVEKFWNLPMRSGNCRYYDNCLYMFSMLALSGKYRIW